MLFSERVVMLATHVGAIVGVVAAFVRTDVLVNNVTFDCSVGGAVPASVPPPGNSSIPSPIALHGSSYGMPPRPNPGPGRGCHRKTTTTRSTLRQRFALACFRYATIAFLSIFESNAASVLDECDWSGITCNANGRVATLVCVLPNRAPGLGGSCHGSATFLDRLVHSEFEQHFHQPVRSAPAQHSA